MHYTQPDKVGFSKQQRVEMESQEELLGTRDERYTMDDDH
jgi:hypothetical protein